MKRLTNEVYTEQKIYKLLRMLRDEKSIRGDDSRLYFMEDEIQHLLLRGVAYFSDIEMDEASTCFLNLCKRNTTIIK